MIPTRRIDALVIVCMALSLFVSAAQSVFARKIDESKPPAKSPPTALPGPVYGNTPEARHLYQKALLDGGNSAVWERAIGEIDQAIALEPDNANFWVLKAEILFSMEEDLESLQAAQKAAKLNPKVERAWFCQARALTALKRPEEGLKCMNMAMSLQPPSSNSYDARSRIFVVLKRWKEAEADLDQAVRLAPGSGLVHADRLAVDLELKNYRKAIEDATACIKSEHKCLESYYHRRAEAYAALHEYDKAEADFKEAVRRSPDDLRVHQQLKSFYQQTGNGDGVEAEEKKIKEINGDLVPM